ncbi:hypothetical protein SAMN05421747_1369, partial [Parapedobacter composti]
NKIRNTENQVNTLINNSLQNTINRESCVYLLDVTQSATLLASHRAGGFHRLMHSVAARTSYIKRFCKIPVLELRSDRNFAKPPARYQQA